MVQPRNEKRRHRRQADRRRRWRFPVVPCQGQNPLAPCDAAGRYAGSALPLRLRRHEGANLVTAMPSVALLAGGLATRMRPLTEKVPKSMLEVAGEPFIAHQLRLFRREGIGHVVLCVGHRWEMMADFVGDGT